MAAEINVMQTSSYQSETEWFMAQESGPAGRMAKVTADPAKQQTRWDNDANDGRGATVPAYEEDGTTPLLEDFYQRTRTITLYSAGKRVAEIPGLSRYEVSQMATQWVKVGR